MVDAPQPGDCAFCPGRTGRGFDTPVLHVVLEDRIGVPMTDDKVTLLAVLPCCPACRVRVEGTIRRALISLTGGRHG